MKTRKYPVLAILLLCGLAGSARTLMAQDEGGSEKAEDAGGKKWFSFFLEVGGGPMALEDIQASIRNNSSFASTTTVSFSDFNHGKVTIGWNLPDDKGRFEAVYNGHREDTYSLNSQGLYSALSFGSDQGSSTLPLIPWWNMEIRDGHLDARLMTPFWSEAENDTNGDGQVDVNEVVYIGEPTALVSKPAITDMQNSIHTYDLQYRRWFGGRRYGGVWSAGLRYLEYDGNIPATFWISNSNSQYGWTSGGFQNPLIFTQETSGFGPTGSLGFEIKYFRDRLHVFGEARLSFLFQSMTTDSGDFFALLPDPGSGDPPSLLSVPATVSSEFDKDVWNVSSEAGVRVRLLSGLYLEAAYVINSYHDAVLMPTRLTIPDVLARIGQPIGGVFRSSNLIYDGVRTSLSFQF